MRSRLLRPRTERAGVGDGTSLSGALLALLIAPSLAAEDGVVVSRPGDLDAASRAAISEVDASDAAEGRPRTLRVLAEGETGCVNRPILSLTEPTSGPRSDPLRGRFGV